MALIAHPEIEVVIEATGDPGTGIRLCQAAIAHGKHIVMVNVEADALAGPLLARQARGGGRRLFAGLGRPAGADLRARRLGAHLRLQGGRRRQGHALPPDLPPLQPRHGVGDPRPVSEDQGPQPHQPQDVQLVHRRHQVGHRDDGGVQRHGAGAAGERPGLPARLALRAGRRVQAQERRRHAGEEGRDRGRLLARPRRQGRAASSGHGHLRRRSRATAPTPASASSSTTACPTRAAATPRSTGPRT